MFKNKYRILFITFSLLILTLSSVNAAEDNITENIVSDDTGNVLKEDYKSFTDLNELINNDNSGEVKLDNDYVYNNDDDSRYEEGITISKQLTIDGQGHTVDAKNHARIFLIESGQFTLKNINLINGYSEGNGGAVSSQNNNIIIANSTFKNNMAQNGGVVYNRNAVVTVENSTFVKNNLKDFSGNEITTGGAISVDYNNIVIKNSVFTDNNAYYGGALHTEDGNITISDSFFKNNNASWYAGGVIHASGNIKVTGSVFNDNSAPSYGGAIFTYGENSANIYIDNSTFTNNTSKHYGGVISAGASVNILNSIFKNNFAQDDGGILSAWHDVTISNSKFINSTSVGGSGAVYAYGANVSVKKSDFINNAGFSSVFWVNGNMTVDESNFLDNHDGDAIMVDGNIEIIKSNFINNQGTYAIVQTNNANIIESNFTNNNANFTGAAKIDGKAFISNSIFTNNTGRETIGGIYAVEMKIINSIFINNKGKYANTLFGVSNITNSKITENNVDVTKNYVFGGVFENTIVVKKASPTLKAPKKTFKTSVKTKKYAVTLKIGKNPLKKVKVYLTIKGKNYKKTFTATTDKNGKATFKIIKLIKKGTYTSTLKYKGNKKYKSVTVKQKISITKKKTLFKQNGKAVLGKDDVQTVTSDTGTYVDPSKAFNSLNKFRTEKKVWYWNDDDKTKTYFNTNSGNTLQPLKWSESLEKAAKMRAMEISLVFDHDRLDGTVCYSAYPDRFPIGENIAAGIIDGDEATEMWKETEDLYSGQGHRRNMLNGEFNCVGIAGFQKDGATYWVQVFGYE